MNRDLLKENRMHGDIMFPLSVYSISQPAGKNIILDCHWHDELEFLMITGGKALFQIDTAQYELEKGQCIFVNSGELHAAYAADNKACSFDAVVFGLSFLQSGTYDLLQSRYIDSIPGRQHAMPRHIKGCTDWEGTLLSRLSEIIRLCFDKPYTYEMQVKALLYQIFSSLLSNSGPAMPAGEATADLYRMERIKSALKLIQDNYHKKLSTRDISLALNLSEGHFCRMFKQLVKKTPIDYLNYYRVNKAARMLETTDKKIIDTAMEVGFDNFSYFISTFKHYIGTTPAKYRAMSRAGK
jgi:AraC-like DNA-binding protein